MPQSNLSLEEKLQNAICRTHQILNKYDGNRDLLSINSSKYGQTKDPALKQYYNDYRNLIRIENTIRDLQTILNDNDEGRTAQSQSLLPLQNATYQQQPPTEQH